VVGHRDKRFGFNNKSMKIGERKRNDMSKIVKENVGPNLSKNTNSIKNARNSQVGKSQQEISKPANKLQKFKTPMRSIYMDKLEPVLHKSFKAFLIKRVKFEKSKFLETISEN
jgi:hypothetical protein